jgi:hypothetical protein
LAGASMTRLVGGPVTMAMLYFYEWRKSSRIQLWQPTDVLNSGCKRQRMHPSEQFIIITTIDNFSRIRVCPIIEIRPSPTNRCEQHVIEH